MKIFQFSRQFMLPLLKIKYSGQKTERFLEFNVGRIGPRLTIGTTPIANKLFCYFCHLKVTYKISSKQQQQKTFCRIDS